MSGFRCRDREHLERAVRDFHMLYSRYQRIPWSKRADSIIDWCIEANIMGAGLQCATRYHTPPRPMTPPTPAQKLRAELVMLAQFDMNIGIRRYEATERAIMNAFFSGYEDVRLGEVFSAINDAIRWTYGRRS